MIDAGSLRPGSTIERGGELYQVLTFDHVKLGRGSAIVRTKLKNLLSNAVTEETFRPEERFTRARIDRSEAQYLYRDEAAFVMMDASTFEQHPVDEATLGDAVRWLKEGDTVFLLTFDGRVIGVELPIAVELEVTYTEPGFRGDTATGGTKPATVETGASVDVPLFVSSGERIRIDTRTGRYMERAG
ncbi:MAG TPA: elongation factor P [Candidatus Dormibacteraeota bacterium]|nr:elongation factor P [Candidatus Dormibacteraeota bacterium]